VVRHLVTVPLTQDDLADFHVPGEHLVEVASLAMSLSTRFDCRGETERCELLDNVVHVVVKVATDNNWCVRILSNNVPNNFCDSLCSLLQVLLLSRLEIAVQNLDIVVSELYLSPAEICPECLHELESSVVSRCIPASATASMHGLE